jgi:hypothetical protein
MAPLLYKKRGPVGPRREEVVAYGYGTQPSTFMFVSSLKMVLGLALLLAFRRATGVHIQGGKRTAVDLGNRVRDCFIHTS